MLFRSKPAGETPLTALHIVDIMERAGLPKGVLNVVLPEKVGPQISKMLHDPRVKNLSFTGSTEVGKILLKEAADQVIRCSMELGGNAPVIVLDDGRKLALVSPHLIPKLALCDPELTLDLPAAMTAGTGMDAMAHCIETFVAPSINPPAEAIARDGMIKVFNYLERAVHGGHDRDARWNMMMAAMEGAMAFQKGLGAVHALSHPLGALKSPRLHHGTLNAIFLPPVLRFNGPVLGDKLQRLATVFAVKADIDAIAKVIEDLNRRIGLPQKLSELGVDRSQFDSIASQALLDHCHATNPRQATHADYVKILEDVY